MSRIDDLIAKMAPNGVPYMPLGDVLRIRNGRDHKALGDGSIPVYGSGGVMRYVDTACAEGPSVLIPRKGSLGNIFYVEGPFWVVDTIFRTEVDSTLLEPKFLYYLLLTLKLEEMNQAGGVPSQTQGVLNLLQVPVPPLELQREIVRILDHFTELEAELEAELETRGRQYSHYRTELLSLPGARHQLLGDLATIGTGSRNTNEAVAEGQYPFYVRSQVPLRIDRYEFNEAAVLTAGDGVGVGKVFHFVEGPYALHQRAYRIVVKRNDLLPRFLFHYIRHDFPRYLATTSVHASVTSLRRPMFEKYPVPLPTMQDQVRIAESLDRFDVLLTDLTIGLPAELAARRRQYEYYRDKLLTFEEKR